MTRFSDPMATHPDEHPPSHHNPHRMLQRISILLLVCSLSACAARNESALPKAGTIVVKRDDAAERYQVTWSGISDYNQGACELNQPCVHLVRTVNVDNRVEMAMTLNKFSSDFRRLE
jgi:hypothetical protein